MRTIYISAMLQVFANKDYKVLVGIEKQFGEELYKSAVKADARIIFT